MKKIKSFVALLGSLLLLAGRVRAQEEWPKILSAADGSIIRIYEPQPESFKGNILKARSAFSVNWKGENEPVFGALWAIMTVETDKDSRIVHIISLKVPNLRLARDSDLTKIDFLKAQLEEGLPRLNMDLSLDALLASLDAYTEEKNLSKGLKNDAPRILYKNHPSLLVLIDGNPQIQHNGDWDVDAVVNTPYCIIRNTDGNFYLYGGKHWYISSTATGTFSHTEAIPPNLEKVQKSLDAASTANAGYIDSTEAADTVISDIIVSTEPAELIQSKGDPLFTAIAGTQLSYVSNSNNDIFWNAGNKQYYVLISGRWYQSAGLEGNWQYVPADALPSDFAKIPEGSPKDNVLASIAGTHAAREAVMDAQIPQTAKVDRKNAKTEVTYDGSPQFENIPGTHMQYAVNTPNAVIRAEGKYYCVDKGVWFESNNPEGPWKISVRRPNEVDLIPPSSPVYNLKYVYIYDVDPDWVYMGYTPGYLNTFIYGPTVVFGTGFYYAPWRGRFFYPRPWTWGFNMWYNPWLGWSFGFDYGWDWFNWDIGLGWGFWFGGWWGPWIYMPPFMGRNFFHHGFYGRNSFIAGNRFSGYNNNIYRSRQDVLNREGPSHVFTDREGNVYRRDGQGSWQQRDGGNWKPVDNSRQHQTLQNLENQEQMRDRGQIRRQNFQMSRGGALGRAFSGLRSGNGFRGGRR